MTTRAHFVKTALYVVYSPSAFRKHHDIDDTTRLDPKSFGHAIQI